MNPHKDLDKAIKLMSEQVVSLQREFGHVVSGKNLIANKVSYPKYPKETEEVKKGVHSLLEGALLVYLFSMWEDHVPKDVSEWLTEPEKQKLNAYKHVRHSVSHGYKGKRATQCRKEFEEEMPFSGIIWNKDTDTINISNSSVALNCQSFMAELTKQLVVRLANNKKPGDASQVH